MELTEKYQGTGVIVMEVQQEATDQLSLMNWVAENDYLAFRTEPANQMELDYRKTELIPAMCVGILIDLKTMKVLNHNCGQLLEGLIESCIDSHL